MKSMLICLLLLFPFSGDWTLEKQTEGIQVFSRPVPGETLKATRSVVTVSVSVNRMLQLITDPNESIHWMDRVESARIIHRESESLFWVHNHISLPWPLDDRDLVARVEITREGGTITVSLTNDPDAHPEQESVVRMPKYAGTWTLESVGQGKTRVICENFSDVGGSIPDWLKSGVVDSAILTMKNLKEYIGD